MFRLIALTMLVLGMQASIAHADGVTRTSVSCRGEVCSHRITEWPSAQAAARDGVVERSREGDPGCPEATSCGAFALLPYGWSLVEGEALDLPYVVSTRSHWNATAAALRTATARAAGAWQAADPRVALRDAGTTGRVLLDTDLPNGVNEVGFGVIAAFPAAAAATVLRVRGTAIEEFDVVLQTSSGYGSAPCEQADRACEGPGGFDLVPGTTMTAVESVMTHELGHVLGLDHPAEQRSDELTMHPASYADGQRRIAQTLGLGDVLGIRAAVPCGLCGGEPRVFVP